MKFKWKKSKAFKRRNKEWPYDMWDYTQWEEFLYEYDKEIKKKVIQDEGWRGPG